MQTKLAKILIILIICILTMGDVIVIAENSAIMFISDEQNAEAVEKLEVKQTLITNKKHKIGEVNKNILQLALEINANSLETSSLKENKVTLTTPIEGVEPEEIYISKLEDANFVDAKWEYVGTKLIINLVNDEIEKIKNQKIDRLILTYVYDGNIDVSKISTKAVSEGKLYNGKKAVSEEIIYEVENAHEFGEIIQITSNIQEIYRTELKKENQEFYEAIQIDLNYKNLDLMDKIILSENLTKAYTGEVVSEVNTKYIATLINKQELLNAIGETAELVVKSGENEICKINKDTESNESGNIVINYEEEISNVTIEIFLGEEKATLGEIANSKINIIHKKEIEKCSENTNYDKLIKEMNLSLEKNKEILKISTNSIGQINDKTTKAELGLDKQILTATKENELTATITLHTENKKYDLNKNPRYEIVFPKEFENIELGDISILNNKDFKIKENQIVENKDGQKVIVIILEGEQTEYTEEAGNVQMVVPLKINTTKLIPTTLTNIELYYTNEKAESYEIAEDFGKEVKEISIIADADLIVSTEATLDEKEVMSYKTDVATLEAKKTEGVQTVEIKGTIINNTETVKENVKIIGENELLNKITPSKGNVYYSETIEGPWADTFSEGQKYFKIEIEKLEIGEKIEFTYNMQIPEVLEESKNYEAVYKVYQAEELEKESKLQIKVEVKSELQEETKIRFKSKIEKYGAVEIENVEIDSDILHKVYIKNNAMEEKNAQISIKIPECVNTENLDVKVYRKTDELEDNGEYIYDYIEKITGNLLDETVLYSINVPAESEILVNYIFNVDKYVLPDVTTNINVLFDGENTNYVSTMKALSPVKIETNLKAYIDEKEIYTNEEVTLNKGENIEYVTTILNEGETTANIEVINNIPKQFKVNKIEIYKADKLYFENKNIYSNQINSSDIELKELENLKIILSLELLEEVEEDIIIEQYSVIKENLEQMETNKISIKLLKKLEKPDEPQNPEKPSDIHTPTNPEEPGEEKYSISGIAWLDKNKNAKQDEFEDYLNGIEVTLLNAVNEKIATTITDMNGRYDFKNLESGKYVVLFGYNTATYNLTTYKKSGIEDTENSDAILTTQNGENIAKTEVIKIVGSDISNIDIGLTLKEKFDLEVSKKINKITVKNSAGQTVYEYQNTDFTKIEIPSKYFKGTNLVIEYEVQILNNGDISGYVKTLTDYKPEKLKFASELNTSWYEGTDGKLYCIGFGEDEIKPGETREVSLVLTKEITDTQIQYITNEVELEDIFNEYLADDKNLENNKSEATLIVAIKTGVVKTYIELWLVCTIIIGMGIYFIKKRVIVKR